MAALSGRESYRRELLRDVRHLLRHDAAVQSRGEQCSGGADVSRGHERRQT